MKSNIGLDYFYKYQKIDDYTIENLSKSQIYFNNPIYFNDPFDTKINYYYRGNREQWMKYLVKSGILESDVESYLDEKIRLKIIRLKGSDLYADKTYICDEKLLHGSIRKNELPLISCFSKSFDNTLLWGHYGQHHKGLCLIYEGVLIKNQSQFLLFSEHLEKSAFGFEKVEYSDTVPEKINRMNNKNYNAELIKGLLTKSSDWAYEEEYRLVMPIFNPIKKGIAIKFDKHHLKGIIFGLKTSPEDMERVYKTIETSYIKEGIGVGFYKTCEFPDNYKIDVKEINSMKDYLYSIHQ